LRRQVSWLAGQGVMHGLPGPMVQWLLPRMGSQCIALAAYSCRDSRGIGRKARPHRIPV